MKDDIYKFFYDNICIIDCPEYYPYEMVFTHQCLSNCLYEDFFNKQCKLKYKTISNIESLINKIDKDITLRLLDSLINSSLKENKEDLIVKEDILTYQITTSENQNEKYYSDISNIYLGDCETKLKQYYNISQNVSLLILKIDYNIPDLLIPMVEYKIYHPETKIPLELDICKDTTIGLSFPISIDDNNLNKHDPTSDLYTDKCYPLSTENKTDIILNDRKKEYNDKYYGICENNCKFTNYESNNEQKNQNVNVKLKQNLKNY